MSSAFETDLENLFSANSAGSIEGESASKDDEWANVDETGEARSIRLKEVDSDPEMLPAVETLARPDILFRSLTPYLLNVTLHGTNKLVVQGTHEPSLQLLLEYLQRWMKRDHRDVRKVSTTCSVCFFPSHIHPFTSRPHAFRKSLIKSIQTFTMHLGKTASHTENTDTSPACDSRRVQLWARSQLRHAHNRAARPQPAIR